jgi:hypothetical protein
VDRDELFKHLLPDVTGKLLADEGGGGFAWPEARQLGPLHDVFNDSVGSAFYLGSGDGNVERVLAAFN